MLSVILTCAVFPLAAANNYVQHNLVSDQAGMADHMDPNLINPWDIAFSSTGPFWITNQTMSLAGIYNSAGFTTATAVATPPRPTGIVANSTTDFQIASGVPAAFLFCSENGTISAWASTLGSSGALVKIDHSGSGAVYTGLARANSAVGSALYAVNFHAGTVEVYDANFNPVNTSGSFQDPSIPAGYMPFNIWATGNKLYVTFAQQDSTKSNPVTGVGKGYVDLFDVNGSLVQSVAAGGTLNAPQGLAIAPPKFGDFAGALLVGNFGDGTIDAFDVISGKALGVLANVSGQTLSIPGLRGLSIGNGGSAGDTNAVYFAAAPSNQSHGLFGSLQGAPVVNGNGIVNAAGYQLGAAPYTFVSIIGNNLAATTRQWQSSDFVNGQLPRSLDGVSASINGIPAYISYISPTQLNVLMPVATAPGSLVMTNNALSGAPVPIQFYQLSPAFFQIGASGFAAATHTDGTLVGPMGQFTSSTRPARVGEVITLYGNGFGVTQADGNLVTSPIALLTAPSITFGTNPAQVIYAGVVAPGLYQFNVVVPQVDSGNVALVAQIGSATSPATMIAIQ